MGSSRRRVIAGTIGGSGGGGGSGSGGITIATNADTDTEEDAAQRSSSSSSGSGSESSSSSSSSSAPPPLPASTSRRQKRTVTIASAPPPPPPAPQTPSGSGSATTTGSESDSPPTKKRKKSKRHRSQHLRTRTRLRTKQTRKHKHKLPKRVHSKKKTKKHKHQPAPSPARTQTPSDTDDDSQPELIEAKSDLKEVKNHKIKSICLEKKPQSVIQISRDNDRREMHDLKRKIVEPENKRRVYRVTEDDYKSLSKGRGNDNKIPEEYFDRGHVERIDTVRDPDRGKYVEKVYIHKDQYDDKKLEYIVSKSDREKHEYGRRVEKIVEPSREYVNYEKREAPYAKRDVRDYPKANERDYVKRGERELDRERIPAERGYIRRNDQEFEPKRPERIIPRLLDREYEKRIEPVERNYDQTRNDYKRDGIRQRVSNYRKDNNRPEKYPDRRSNGDDSRERPSRPIHPREDKNSEGHYRDRQQVYQRHDDQQTYPQHRRGDDNYRNNGRDFQGRQPEYRNNQPREYQDKRDSHSQGSQKYGSRYEGKYAETRDVAIKDEPAPAPPSRDVRRPKSPERDRARDRDRPGPSNNKRDRSNDKRKSSPRNSRWENDKGSYEWGKKDKNTNKAVPPEEKDKPNFGLSGKLTEETNTVNGIVIKYSEPSEARKPKRRWRFYPFKGDKALQILYIHRQSAFLLGRDRAVADIPLDHPSISKQHAVLQYRLVPFKRDDGTMGKRVRPYIIDLESANGTFVNNNKIESSKYVELLERDVVKFGFSLREYVLLHENSKDEDMDDDDDVKPTIKTEEEEMEIKHEPDD